ncbi:hypothetical protein VTH8203_01353 [Vibrio thalassae]|uniref:Uncharacterized protein n=1 Tax=Vibrio thalassae TaxID=1243014 RepID=A0A240EGB7_9VIBR|nr:hypothetical protein [Vibrio thalassae]SNX47738.1 hypothetical protein VTH8203_01353 [Vibrio thalassae]
MKKLILAAVCCLFYALTPLNDTQASQSMTSMTPHEPETVCRVENPANAGIKCKNSDVFLFLPNLVGNNSNLPVIVSAIFCNFRYPIITTPDAVTCVFSDSRKASWSEYGVAE